MIILVKRNKNGLERREEETIRALNRGEKRGGEGEKIFYFSTIMMLQGYHCGSTYIPLSDISTWKIQQLYNSKLSREKISMNEEEKQKITKKLFAGLEINLSLDLSEKVKIAPEGQNIVQ